MSWIDSITPKDTQELRPGLFIQIKKDKYRVINPFAWNGKVRWKEQLQTIFNFEQFIRIAVILFLVWSYVNDVSEYKSFYEEIHSDVEGFCNKATQINNADLCNEDYERKGLCVMKGRYEGLNISDIRLT